MYKHIYMYTVCILTNITKNLGTWLGIKLPDKDASQTDFQVGDSNSDAGSTLKPSGLASAMKSRNGKKQWELMGLTPCKTCGYNKMHGEEWTTCDFLIFSIPVVLTIAPVYLGPIPEKHILPSKEGLVAPFSIHWLEASAWASARSNTSVANGKNLVSKGCTQHSIKL